MLSFFKRKYRIVDDNFAGYEAQVKYWWWPFWIQCFGVNTASTLSGAQDTIKRHYRELHKRFVEYYDPES